MTLSILRKSALLGAMFGAFALMTASNEANAVTMTEINDGDTVNLSDGPFRFSADIEDDGDGTDTEMLMFEFVNDLGVDDLVTITFADVDQDNTGLLQNLFLGGISFEFGAATKTVAEGVSETFTLASLVAAGDSVKLKINFAQILNQPDLDFAVGAVPLPPALLLLLSSIGGLAWLGRRRTTV